MADVARPPSVASWMASPNGLGCLPPSFRALDPAGRTGSGRGAGAAGAGVGPPPSEATAAAIAALMASTVSAFVRLESASRARPVPRKYCTRSTFDGDGCNPWQTHPRGRTPSLTSQSSPFAAVEPSATHKASGSARASSARHSASIRRRTGVRVIDGLPE